MTPETFAKYCNGAEKPVLTPEAEKQAKAVLQDIEDQTAALEDGDPNEGLAEGFYRENSVVMTIVGAGKKAHEVHLCSNC